MVLKLKTNNFKNRSRFKDFVIFIYKIFQFLQILIATFFKPISKSISVYYGGSFTGDIGGPLVKRKRLNKYFPENKFSFNIVYLLSNANYLNKYSIDYLKIKKKPIILNQNGVYYSAWYKGDWKKKNLIMSYSYNLADYVFWQSAFCRKMADQYLGKREGPGEILFNAVDTKKDFFPIKKKYQNLFTFLITGKFDINMFYRLESSLKGLAIANKEGIQCKLKIAGWMHHEIKANLIYLVERLNLNQLVDITGPFNQLNARKIYQSADAYLITKCLDPCPNVVIEAMSCGLPILYSNSGGIPELVTNNCGVSLDLPKSNINNLSTPEPQVIAEGMDTIIKSHKIMAINSRLRAIEQFEISNWICRHEKVFSIFLKN